MTEYWWGDEIGVKRENCYLHDYCGDPWGGNAPGRFVPSESVGPSRHAGGTYWSTCRTAGTAATRAPPPTAALGRPAIARDASAAAGLLCHFPATCAPPTRAAAAFVHRDGVNAGFRVARTLGREAPRRMVDTAAPAAPPQRLAATSDACVPPRTTDAASRSVFEHCLRIGRLGRLGPGRRRGRADDRRFGTARVAGAPHPRHPHLVAGHRVLRRR